MNWKLTTIAFVAACGGKSATPSNIPEDHAEDATCAQVGERTAKDAADKLPQGLPADAGDRYGEMITQLCIDDAWAQEVINCGMTSDNPKDECSPQLTAAQRDHLEVARQEFAMQMAAEMGSGDPSDLLEPTGMALCDAFRKSVFTLSTCEAARAELGDAGIGQFVAGARMLASVPAEQQAEVESQCEGAMGQTDAMLAQFKCTAE